MNSHQKQFLGHPAGLFILFLTEMWERFSYYGMRAILVLYMTTSATAENAGLGWANGDAIALYGWYTMLVYVMSIPGGIIADKFIGQKRSVLYGGLILVLGHSVLAIEEMWAFYTGLSLIVIGVGGLKPNISTLVGGLYKEGDIRRDKGFTIFYIGINIGAAAASLLVGWIGETYGWHYGFGLAGIGMLLGQVVYMWGQKFLVHVGNAPDRKALKESDDSLSKLVKNIFKHKASLISFFGLIALAIYVGMSSIGYGLLWTFLAFVVGFLIAIYQELEKKEKDRYLVLLLSFLIVIVFWGAFEQAGGLMNIYTKEKVNRIVMGTEIPASVFQSVNALFIIIFGTLVANFWARRKRKGKESSSLYKMAIGTIIMGAGFLFMAKASLEVLSTGQAALVWIILAYLFHTLGELSASPVALSFITKLAPGKYVSIMMGVYFAATGLGNKVAGSIGEASQLEEATVQLVADANMLQTMVPDSLFLNADNFSIDAKVYNDNNKVVVVDENGNNLENLLYSIDEENAKVLAHTLDGEEATAAEPYKITFSFGNKKDKEALSKLDEGKEAGFQVNLKNYEAKATVFEVANKTELRIFIIITIFTAAFGFLLILFLRTLKRLTHGVEDQERDMSEDQAEGYLS